MNDERYGEELAAWIKLKESCEVDEIKEFCRGKVGHLVVEILLIDDFCCRFHISRFLVTSSL